MFIEKPAISVDTRFHAVTVQESLTLTCSISGHVDYFLWIYENPNRQISNLIYTNKTYHGNFTSYTLYFDEVTFSNEGIYRCEAGNDAGVSSGDGVIYVSAKEKVPTPVSEYPYVVSRSIIKFLKTRTSIILFVCLRPRLLHSVKLKFFKSRSKVTVKVTCSKFMVPTERSCHKEHSCQI